MELAAVLLMCAVMALVFYRVTSRPLLPHGPDDSPERPDGTRTDTADTGRPKLRRRPF